MVDLWAGAGRHHEVNCRALRDGRPGQFWLITCPAGTVSLAAGVTVPSVNWAALIAAVAAAWV